MQDAILEKITPCLAGAPQSERDVVYVLVEIRKLLERDGRTEICERLKFYCDWALHAEMSYRIAHRVLREIDTAIVAGAEGKKRFFEMFLLEEFRKQLQDFCDGQGLPANWSSNDVWPQFVRYYAAIVQDCPLRITATPPTTKHIREIILTACRLREPENSFQVRWELRCLDGTSEVVDTVLSPAFRLTAYLGAYDISV